MTSIEETDHRFYIAESTIPNGGLGVFAKEKINKGDFLEIIGVIAKCGSIVDQCTHYANRYKFANEPEKSFQNVLIPMGYAALVNQANDKEHQNVSITHLPEEVACSQCKNKPKIATSVKLVCSYCGGNGILKRKSRNPHGGPCVYLATRDIEPGEEILGHYGKKIGHLVIDGQSFTQEDQKEWYKFLNRKLYGLEILLEDKDQRSNG